MGRREFIIRLSFASVFFASVWPVAATAQSNDRVRVLQSRILQMQAQGVADKITQFIKEVENQAAWTTQVSQTAGSIEQRRFDALRLLRQTPAITELLQLDHEGKEHLKVSRLAMDVIGSGTDYSKEAKFTEALAKKVYYGPVYLRRESEPYMTLGLAGTRHDTGVSVLELNLKLLWDLVRQTKVGEQGVAYVVDAEGRVIAHPDFDVARSLWNLSPLAHVQEARTASLAASTGLARLARDMNGREVLAAYARIAGTGWLAFVELPIGEAK